jgi:Undecaprenyl-phosphate glucose phosphotransferase
MAIQYGLLDADRSESSARVAEPRRSPSLLTRRIVAGLAKVLDFFAVMLAGALALHFFAGDAHSLRPYFIAIFLGSVFFVNGLERAGGYQFRQLSRLRSQLGVVIAIWSVVASALVVLASFANIYFIYSPAWILGWTSTTPVLLVIERVLLFQQIKHWRREGKFVQRLVIFGAGPPGQQLVAEMQAASNSDVVVVAIFDDRSTRIPPTVGGLAVGGTSDDLIAFVRQTLVDQVIVALPWGAERRAKTLFDKLRSLPVDLRLSASSAELSMGQISFTGGTPMFEIWNRPIQHWNAVAKTALDKMLACVLLLLLAVPMALIALLIKLESRGPIFFVQNRFGYNNQVIRVLKFRTMYAAMSDSSGAQRTVRNDPRVTRIGYFLRRFSLDELPQLINVVRGDLSLVGPRPHAVAMRVDNRLYQEAVSEYFERHKVKPGITGWAQINGHRGEVDSAEAARQRVRYDIEYIDRWSLLFDLKILLATIVTVLRREKAY